MPAKSTQASFARRVACLGLLLGVGLILSACQGGPPPFKTGFRVVTTAVDPYSGQIVPAGNVQVQASLVQVLGPGTGAQTNVAGFTIPAGYIDFPDARTDAIWTITVSFASSSFPCGVSSGQYQIPSQGGVINVSCGL